MTASLILIVTLTVGVLVAPVAAEAQQAAKVPRIGVLAQNWAASGDLLETFFIQGLRDLGYVESRDLVIEYRDAEGKHERLPALAAELVALKVDVIVAPSMVAARAAKHATRMSEGASRTWRPRIGCRQCTQGGCMSMPGA